MECAGSQQIWEADALRALAERTARTLRQAGLREGEHVLLALANNVGFPVTLVALLQLGCNPVLVYAGSTVAEIERLGKRFGAEWLLHDFADGMSRIPADGFAVERRMRLGALEIALLRVPAPPAGGAVMRVAATGVILHPTSGTGGRSAYCVRNQRVAVAEARNYVARIKLYDQARVRMTTPLSHAYAYGFGLVACIITDSFLVLNETFNPKRILREEGESPCRILAIVPPMAKTLARIGGGEASISETVFLAGAPCPPGVAAAFAATFRTPLFSIYGTTETGAIASDYAAAGPLPGVGPTLPGVEVAVANTQVYAGLGDGLGELVVRSSSMMQGYVHDLPLAAPIACWSTGDLGYKDGEGNITIVGRSKDIINLGGMKVDPVEVERVLLEHPGIEDAAVYPGLRDDGSEFVQAAVAPRGGAFDEAALRAHCLRRLAPHALPTIFHRVSEVRRSASGKCLKFTCPGFPPRLALGRDDGRVSPG